MAREFFRSGQPQPALRHRQARAKSARIVKRLALEALEPRAMLANVAPVAVNDTLNFAGFVQRNVTEGVEAITYIEAGSTWFYSDDNSDQRAINPEWNAGPEAGFDPATGSEPGWAASGPAPLGFGNPVVTTLFAGHSAYYFHRPFNVDGPIPESLLLGVQVDDCAAIYINGVEVHRTAAFGFGPISHDTLCAGGTPSETTFFEAFVDAGALDLRPTGNTIAVEVHQQALTSGDVSFDLRLQRGNVGLLANDQDANTPREQLTVEVVDASRAAPYGTLEVSPDGAVAFMPIRPQIGGRFSFTYRVLDNDAIEPLTSNVATVTVHVAICDCGAAVVAVDDIGVPEFVTAEDTPLVIDAATGPNGPLGSGVLANDLRVLWGEMALPYVRQQPTSGGRVEFSGSSGGFTYTPGRNFVGVDTFRYAVGDGYTLSSSVAVEIVVTPVDDVPVVVTDWFTSVAGERFAATVNEALIRPRSEWFYFDELTIGPPVAEDYPEDALGRRWNTPDFDMATSDPDIGAWKSGRGIFAGPLLSLDFPFALDGTTMLLGDSTTHVTTLFRRSFELTAEEAGRIDELAIDMLHDDGAVVYINGFEVLRAAMPPAPAVITSTTRATRSTVEQYQPYRLGIAPGVLLPGTNTIAVEVHQVGPASSDRGFDLGLYKLPAGANGQSVLFNDYDPEDDPIQSAALVPDSGPLGTLVEFNPDGTFVYDPPPGYLGIDSFKYTATSVSGTSLAGTVRITVAEPPVFHDDVYRTAPGEILFVEDVAHGVLGNDLHLQPPMGVLIWPLPSGEKIIFPEGTLTWISYRASGSVGIGDGAFSFEPAAGVTDGQVRYEYVVGTSSGEVGRATLTIHISDVSFDLNGDGPIDSRDLAVLVGNFGMESGATNADGDLNRDGHVSLADVLLLRNRIGAPLLPSAAAVVASVRRLDAAAVDRGIVRTEPLAAVQRTRRMKSTAAERRARQAAESDAATQAIEALAATRLRGTRGRKVVSIGRDWITHATTSGARTESTP